MIASSSFKNKRRVRWRRLELLSRALRSSLSVSAGNFRSGRRWLTGNTGVDTCMSSTACTLGPEKGGSPVSMWYRMAARL